MYKQLKELQEAEDGLLQRQDVRSRDGVSVDEGQELLEDGEEGPVGQDADALLDVDTSAADGTPVHHAEQTQLEALPLRQQVPAERLVELDGGAVNLRDTSQDLHFLQTKVKTKSAF